MLEKSKIGMDFSPTILENIYPFYFDDGNDDSNYKKIGMCLLEFGDEGLNSVIRLLKRKYDFEDLIQVNKYSILIELLSGIKENEKKIINCLNDIFLNNKVTSIKISVLKTLAKFRDSKSKLKIIPKLVQDMDGANQNLDSGEKLNFEDTIDRGKLFLKVGEEFLTIIGSENLSKTIQEETNLLLQFYYTYALWTYVDEKLGWKYMNRFLKNNKFRIEIPDRFEWIIESYIQETTKI